MLMQLVKLSVVLFGLMVSTFSLSSCDYTLELLLHTYHNPHHKLYNGLCCDSPSNTACYLDPCDNVFYFCLLQHDSPQRTTNSYLKEDQFRRLLCPKGWSNYTTGLVMHDSDNITFPSEGGWISLHRKVRNPLTFTGDTWPGGFQLLVLVVDLDQIKRELVDILVHDWKDLSVSEDFSKVEEVKGMAGSATLSVSARVSVADGDCGIWKPPPPITTQAQHPTTAQTTPTNMAQSTPTDLAQTTPTNMAQTTPTIVRTTFPVTTQSNITMPIVVVPGSEFNRELEQIVQGPIGASNTSNSTVSARVVGAAVGGVLGALVLLGLVVMVIVVVCFAFKTRQREDSIRLTGSGDTEVTALYNGPGDNPNYTGVVSNGVHITGDNSTSHGFSNSLYGALSGDSASHDSQETSGDGQVTYTLSQSHSPLTQPESSEYSVIPQDNVTVNDSPAYANVSSQTNKLHRHSNTDRGSDTEPHEGEVSQYRVITRENMLDTGYSVITRENMLDTGYSVITRDNLVSEASDSEDSHTYSEPHDSQSEDEDSGNIRLLN